MSEILKTFLKNEASLRRFLARFSLSAQDIDDFTQETFLRGFAAEIRQEIREPRAYLFQVAKSIAIDKIRRNNGVRTERLEDSEESSLLIDEGQTPADDWLDGRRKLALFARAVAQLPPQCRKAFIMRRVEELGYKQIANRMNISVSAVEKHVTTGLLKCNAYLREQGIDTSSFGGSQQKKLAAPKYRNGASTEKKR